MSDSRFSRRRFLGTGSVATAVAAGLSQRISAAEESGGGALKGRIRHSVCQWCYQGIALDDLCRAAKDIGIASIDLIGPDGFETLKKHDLVCGMVSAPSIDSPHGKLGGIERALNRTEHHPFLEEVYRPHIEASARAGFRNVICFSGNRDGLDDEKGLENCAEGLKKLLPIAEKHGVTLSMELLNSRVNHPDYMCDRSAWGVELCRRVSSPHFKLLYDIYHMQVMEGDISATIRRDHEYFSHYHTGGVPGRAEIDDSQELYYPAIMQAILDTGYKGFVAQEFVPKRPDKIASLRQAVGICDI